MNNFCWLKFVLASILALIPCTNQASIHSAVHLCKRNDPNISECFCENFKKMIPILKDGAPQMRIPPLDPIKVDNVVMDLTRLQALHLIANLFNITGRGMSNTQLPACRLKIIDTGLELSVALEAPLLTLDSFYNIVGSFENFTLNATGDFHAEFSKVYVATTWTAIKYIKKNMEYLDLNCTVIDFDVGNVNIHFHKVFADNPKMDETINALVAANIDKLTDQVEPIAVNILKSIAVQMVDTMYDTFPYDVLFPLE